VPTRSRFAVPELSLRPLHAGQARAYWALQRHRFKALRCGRRFGKTDFAKVWISQGLVQGFECAWFAPQHMTWSEVYVDLTDTLRPILDAGSKGAAVIRTRTGGRLDFWSMENSIAGRGRRYHRIVIDEATFTKDGDNRTDGSAMAIWEKGIKPTLYDFGGEALVCSNSAGQNPDNFFYNICTDPRFGFHEYHATTLDNPLLPKRLQNESLEAWQVRRDGGGHERHPPEATRLLRLAERRAKSEIQYHDAAADGAAVGKARLEGAPFPLRPGVSPHRIFDPGALVVRQAGQHCAIVIGQN
jgi:hypothetical protein